eukprot:sb/3478626/
MVFHDVNCSHFSFKLNSTSFSLLLCREPTDRRKQPIRTRYLSHVTGFWKSANQGPVFPDSVEPTDRRKQPIRTRYLSHVTGFWKSANQGPVFPDSVVI